MKVDVTSMFFNSSIKGGTATAAWGTSIGQNASKSCKIETEKDGVIDFIIGMTYKSVTNFTSLDISRGSGNRQLLMLSSFDKVFVNHKLLEGARYHVILVKELSVSHYGRLIICYAPYIKYEEYSNEQTIELMRNALECSENGCWFVYDISVKNQDELHFSAVVVNPEYPMVYQGTSRERSLEWNAMIGRDEEVYEIPDEKQVIYYGCPGSGKSHKVKNIVDNVDSDYVFRTTFHPDTDYSAFVGCYKPLGDTIRKQSYMVDELKSILIELKSSGMSYPMQKFAAKYYYALENLCRADKEAIATAAGFTSNFVTEMDKSIAAGKYMKRNEEDNNITYRFWPQVFTNAYIKAWKNLNRPVYLIIEEINRGNCAQIFGDLFQLLDRDKETGKSEYPIKADKDLVAYIEKELGVGHEGIKNEELCLPPNLIIYATMNTSDQSLFPMDSAFKRRWDWEYVPINYNKDIDSGKFIIKIDDTEYLWVDFLEIVNEKIYDVTNSEDKQMGIFFIKKNVEAKEFVNKVMFYLWNEVCKEEYGTQRNFFRRGKEGNIEFKFTDLFGADQTAILNEFMTGLGVKPNRA